ncbi:hypothetical protein L7F22_028819 [Adiantum nelumboides]|nr:hypothetical protein [Adiantum nelumboides]
MAHCHYRSVHGSHPGACGTSWSHATKGYRGRLYYLTQREHGYQVALQHTLTVDRGSPNRRRRFGRGGFQIPVSATDASVRQQEKSSKRTDKAPKIKPTGFLEEAEDTLASNSSKEFEISVKTFAQFLRNRFVALQLHHLALFATFYIWNYVQEGFYFCDVHF